MRDAQIPDHVSLTNMVSYLRDGQYVIPDFQRDFEWEPGDINELMRSIFLDYYIGSLLLWKGKTENYEALACEPIYGHSGGSKGRTFIVLDGQQRLTAMYYAFMAPDKPAPYRRSRYLYFIKVDKFMDERDDAFLYDWTRRGLNLLNNRKQQFESHMFPLSVIGASGWELFEWVRDYLDHWRQHAESRQGVAAVEAERHAENAKKFGEYLKTITDKYQISYIGLDKDLELSKVCEIFTKINSRGVRLDTFDLFNALLRPKGLQLKHLWREVAPRLRFIESDRLDVYVLQVMSILRQAYCSPKYLYNLLPGSARKVREPNGGWREEVLVASTSEFKEYWFEAVGALERAIELLRHPQEFGVISYEYLPYSSIVPVFAALRLEAGQLPHNQRLDAQNKIRLWYWASIFMNQYSGAVESTSARDYQDIKKWFSDDLLEPTLIADFRRTIADFDLRSEVRKGTSIYNGMFNLLIINGARDWITGTVSMAGDLDDHHIIPKSRGDEFARKTSIDTILNRAPLTAETNRNIIRDRLPNEYLPELISNTSEGEMRRILEAHLISERAFDILMRNPFTPSDFEEFVEERHAAFLKRIQSLL